MHLACFKGRMKLQTLLTLLADVFRPTVDEEQKKPMTVGDGSVPESSATLGSGNYGPLSPLSAKNIGKPTARLFSDEHGKSLVTFLTHSPRLQNNSVDHLSIRETRRLTRGVATGSASAQGPIFVGSNHIQWPMRLVSLASAVRGDPLEPLAAADLDRLTAAEGKALELFEFACSIVDDIQLATVPNDLPLRAPHKQLILPVVIDGCSMDILITPVPSIPVGVSIRTRRDVHTQSDARNPSLAGRSVQGYLYNKKWQNTGFPGGARVAYLLHSPMTDAMRSDYRAAYGLAVPPIGAKLSTLRGILFGELSKAVEASRRLERERDLDSNDKTATRLCAAVAAGTFVLCAHLQSLRGAFSLSDIDVGDETVKAFISDRARLPVGWFDFVSDVFMSIAHTEISSRKLRNSQSHYRIVVTDLGDFEVDRIKSYALGAASAYAWN